MKYSITKSIIALLILLASCSTSVKDTELTGTWQVVDCQINTSGGQISTEIIEKVRELLLSSSFVLNEDKSFELRSTMDINVEKGTWKINNGDEIEFMETSQKSHTYQIKSHEQGAMTWIMDNGDNGDTELKLEKVK
jgi:hypothetical protein